MTTEKRGILYIVGTPIGNLEDITFRAVKVLKEVDLIAAEDTRQTKKLLAYYDIKTPILSYREENREHQGQRIIDKLEQGKDVALVSDAGTPCISDPGIHLVNLALNHNIKVCPIPGPSALIAALSVAGLKVIPFLFIGFLPQRKGRRKKLFESLKNLDYTVVFYESPHRFLDTLEILDDILPNATMVVARELTKRFEEIKRGKVFEIKDYFKCQGDVKGELTVILRLQR